MAYLKLVTFDATGTLLVLRESVGQVYSRVGAKHGISAPANALSASFKTVFKKMLVTHPNFGEGGIGWPHWWKKLVIQTFEEANPTSQHHELNTYKYDSISSELIEKYQTNECWSLADGAEDLLNKLKGEGINLGVISNYDPRLEIILENLNIHTFFQFVVTSYGARCSKPDTAIFKTVENMYKDINGSKTLHIGDNVKLDYDGAKNVGWNALLIAKNIIEIKENHPHVETDWVVTDLNHIYHSLLAKQMLSAKFT